MAKAVGRFLWGLAFEDALPPGVGELGVQFYVQVSNLEGIGVTCGCEGLEEADRRMSC